MCIMCMWVSQCMCVPIDSVCVCVCVCVCHYNRSQLHPWAKWLHNWRCPWHSALCRCFFFFLFSACCPDSNYWGFSRGGKARRWGEGACTAWFCQLTGCSVCGTARQPRIPGVRLGETQGLVISTNLNQKPEIVSCHTLFVIFDTLPLLWPRPLNNTYLHTHTHTHTHLVFSQWWHIYKLARAHTHTHTHLHTDEKSKKSNNLQYPFEKCRQAGRFNILIYYL